MDISNAIVVMRRMREEMQDQLNKTMIREASSRQIEQRRVLQNRITAMDTIFVAYHTELTNS